MVQANRYRGSARSVLAATLIVLAYSSPEENGFRVATMIVMALLIVVPLAWHSASRHRDQLDHAFFVDAVANRGRRPLDPDWSVPERPPNEMALVAQDNDQVDQAPSRALEVKPLFVGVVGRFGWRAGRRPLDLAPDPKSIYPLSRPRQDATWD